MVDMGQADRTLRVRQTPVPYGWSDVEPPHPAIKRGDVCVIRQASGKPEILRISPQSSYRAWAGCFTYLGEQE